MSSKSPVYRFGRATYLNLKKIAKEKSNATRDTENPTISNVLVFSAMSSLILALSSDPAYSILNSSQVSRVKQVV